MRLQNAWLGDYPGMVSDWCIFYKGIPAHRRLLMGKGIDLMRTSTDENETRIDAFPEQCRTLPTLQFLSRVD